MNIPTPPLLESPLRERPRHKSYPDPNTGLGRAWADAWTALVLSGTEYLDGTELAEQAATPNGLKPSTMVSFFTRAATAGVLEREHRIVTGTRGPRKRTFYRVPARP